ncbi:hypothetical protein N7490_010658 [Penicillium lividum]|nr:hypothetical protein N7490_010658 [Penicillium lividum]
MILPGLEIASRNLVRNIRLAQQQPCGIDLTLNKISQWNSAAILDFDNTKRKAAKVSSLPFNETITLQPGAYLVEFNETVKIPLNCMASVFPRSSLWRSGVDISSGVVDAGYEGVMGCLMDVKNPYGVVLYRGSKLAQIVFEEMGREVEGYKGIYQLSSSVGGQH